MLTAIDKYAFTSSLRKMLFTGFKSCWPTKLSACRTTSLSKQRKRSRQR